VPRRSTGELTLLKQDHVITAQFRQVVGDAAPDDATSDDDDLRPARERLIAHGATTRSRRNGTSPGVGASISRAY